MASKIVELAQMFASGVNKATGTAAAAEKDVKDVKDAAIVYASTTLILQLIATGAAVTLAYVAVQNMNHNKRTMFNNPKKKRRKS